MIVLQNVNDMFSTSKDSNSGDTNVWRLLHHHLKVKNITLREKILAIIWKKFGFGLLISANKKQPGSNQKNHENVYVNFSEN